MYWASWVTAIVLLALLYVLGRYKVSFGIRVLAAMILGVAVGAIFQKDALDIALFGTVYISLIKMIVIPLVVTAIISSITTLTDPGQLKSVGAKTIGLFIGTTAIAAIFGLITAKIFNVGSGFPLEKVADFKAREVPKFLQIITDNIPSNPIAEMSTGKIIPVIIFAIFIAVAIIVEGHRKPEVVKPFKDFINSFKAIMFRVTKFVIKLTPYGVFGLMTAMAAKYGLDSLTKLGPVILAVYLAAILQMVITNGGLVLFAAKVNPIRFFRKAYPVIAVAFTTRSSYATLPVNLETITKRIRVSDRIASFVAPLGATINMNGCGGLYPAIVAVFVANVYGVELTFYHYAIIVGAAAISSIGTAGVPGPASISTTVVLGAAGLPIEGMAMVLGIDAILDMARTAVNATGTTVSSLVVAVSEKEFDRDGFNHGVDEELENYGTPAGKDEVVRA
ncbi:dicarboxylate/amino acid:cation symporter [Paenibacillus sp. KN14-4R]|uniref:dicarboxylate/amino acid:cation symporter n=1 Tax=Paenibacillus sp. KN14-4R TaxID=3445773 RepID=UPI003FA04FC4